MTRPSDHRCVLTHASSVQENAAAKGFDWTHPLEALEKVREEADEFARLAGADSAPPDALASRLREELGDLLFAVVNVARLAEIAPAPALAEATSKFERRFAEVERIARLRRLPMPGTPLESLDHIWEEVKSREPRD